MNDALSEEVLIMNVVYVVTYWDKGEEPTVTVFNNEFSAHQYYDYIKDKHFGSCIDDCPVYHLFNVSKDDFNK